jgi:hypothetical protein
MSVGLIVELVALSVALLVGVAAVYVIFEMRTVYSDHQERFVRVVTAVESFQKRLESDSHALQSIAVQIQRAVAELNNTIPSAAVGWSDRHAAAIRELRDHLDLQESKLAEIVQNFADDLRTLQQIRRQPEHSNGNGEYVRLNRDMLARDPQLRLSLLKDWVDLNRMAIERRVGRPWTTPKQLILGVPDSFEAEVEVLDNGGLRVGTRGHSEKITIPIESTARVERPRAE